MPTVPTYTGEPLAQQGLPRVDPVYLAMAAATMHEMGRLVAESGTQVAGDVIRLPVIAKPETESNVPKSIDDQVDRIKRSPSTENVKVFKGRK